MKKVIGNILNPQWFALCYLPFLAINMMQPINPMMVTRVFLAIFAIWGVAVAAKCYFTGKAIWVKKYMPILLCFLAVCLATQVFNLQYGGIRVIGEWCFFAICILLLYTQNTSDAEGYGKLLKRVSTVLGLVISIMMLMSLWMFVNMYSQQITTRSGSVLTIGFTNNRLYGVFSSPNVGGLFATILVWCSIVSLYLRKEQKTYPIWIAVSVIQILLAVGYISVALSYGTFLLGFAFVVVFCLLRPAFRFEQKLQVWQRYAVRIISAAVVVALCVGLIAVSNALLLRMMQNYYDRTTQSMKVPTVSEESAASEEETEAQPGTLQGMQTATADHAITATVSEDCRKMDLVYTTNAVHEMVQFAVWSEINGEDDLQWYTAQKNDDGQWVYSVDMVTHNSAGIYRINVYSIDNRAYTIQISTTTSVARAVDARAVILENAKQGFGGRVEAQMGSQDFSNKRFDIWKNHLEIMTGKNILFGVNDPWIYFQKNSAQGVEFTHQQLIFIEWAKGNMHNGFLQIFVNCGIVALGLMLIFLVICFVKCLGMFTWGVKQNIERNNLQYTLFALSAPMVVCILADNLVETNFVLMGANFFQAVFWFAAGICVLCVTQMRKEKE